MISNWYVRFLYTDRITSDMHLYSREQAINMLIATEYQRTSTVFNPREKTGTPL